MAITMKVTITISITHPIEGGTLFGGKAVQNHKRGGEADAEACSGGRRDHHHVDDLRDHDVHVAAGFCVNMVMPLHNMHFG